MQFADGAMNLLVERDTLEGISCIVLCPQAATR